MKSYDHLIYDEKVFNTLHSLQKQNMLVTSEEKYRFSGIFIWFDRVRQGLQEYGYQNNSDTVSNTKLEENQKD
ncbi:unnamed protein product [Rotaria sp. Silwood2]|nr:unnamed protein product [Rotaria sp. Silwood2]CAF4352435.1 unnamed protein product [Rotaria sp. Silwood2]